MSHIGMCHRRCLPRLLVLLLVLLGSSLLAHANPAVLVVGHGYGTAFNSYNSAANPWALPKLLGDSFDIDVGGCSMASLASTDASVDGSAANLLLEQFNAVIVCDLSRIVVGYGGAATEMQISQTDFNRLVSNLLWYVNQGGGLYIYGDSFTSASNWYTTDALNQFLSNLNATVAFEELHDTAREAQQSGGRAVRYALANTIATHAATTNVSNFWYPVGEHSHGPWTKPLLLGQEWTPLISASSSFTTTPMTHTDPTSPGGTTIIPSSPPACFYACRTYGGNGGRIILNGSESTISLFNYNYSTYANLQWGVIGMQNGLNGTASDGLQLLDSSLTWLTAPTLGVFGPYSPPAPTVETANPISWTQSDTVPTNSFYKGVIGAKWSPGGGTATVAQYATQAASMGLGFLVCVADHADANMNQTQWNNFVSACQAATTGSLLVVPALLTQDAQNDRFLQCGFGTLNWPQASRVTSGRVTDHLGYWITDNNMAMRFPYKLSQGNYPAWLYSAINAFAIRTYENNNLVEDCLTDYQKSHSEGNWPVSVVVTLLTSTAQLSAAPEFTYLKASSQNDLQTKFTANTWAGAPNAYVSTGPSIDYFNCYNSFRYTAAALFLSGTERWRVYARATAAQGATLTNVKIYDGTQVLRSFDVSGTSWSANIDVLQDRTKFLTMVVTDTSGRAVSSGVGNSDDLFRQYFSSDRCNIMSGLSAVQEVPGGPIARIQASSNINRAGALYYSTTAGNQILPGIDQIFAALFTVYPQLEMTTTQGQQEQNAEVHDITRTYESADAFRFDTPILKRTTLDYSTSGHYTYMPLVTPNVGANLTQHHFYRNPFYPSPMMAELSMTITDPNGATLGNGWNNLNMYYGKAWSTAIHSYVIVRADNTVITGPTDRTTTTINTQYGTLWNGTLNPGDYVLFPDIAEGFFVLGNQGPCYIEIQCTVPNNWFRFFIGRNDTPTLAQGSVSSVRLLNLKTIDIVGLANQDALIAEWSGFRNAYGIKDGAPTTYAVTPTQGSVTAKRYLVELAAGNYGFKGVISQSLPDQLLRQRLPIKITGLNPQWTAAKVDLVNNKWFPLPVLADGSAYTTVDPDLGASTLYLGNLVTVDNANVSATLLPANADGNLYVDLHNATGSDAANVHITVPVATYLAPVQTTAPVTVPHGSTVRVQLSKLTVSLTSPADGAVYNTSPATIALTATAAESGGSVSKVEFYQGSTYLGEDAGSPYSYNWTNVAAGNYTLTAKAYGTNNAVLTSTPVQIFISPAGMQLWLKADAGITKDGYDRISAWADQSGQGANVTQGTGTYQPLYTAGSINGLPVVHFDGTNDVMASSAVTLNQQHTIVAVARVQSVAGTVNNPIFSYASTSNNAAEVEMVAYDWCGSYIFRCRYPGLDPWNQTNMKFAMTMPVLMTQVKGANGSTAVKCYVNGTKVGPDQAVTTNFSTTSRCFRLGRHSYYGEYLPGDIAEVLVFDHDLTDSDRQIVESYLKTKYGLTQAPPTVTLTAPASSSHFASPANITLTATASDSDGIISKVDFYADNVLRGTDTTAPYSFTWNNVSVGNHIISVVATDNSNVSTAAFSPAYPVTVDP
ncbi:MAG: Ig-like domain-containing protein [Armatimonadota bacterium]